MKIFTLKRIVLTITLASVSLLMSANSSIDTLAAWNFEDSISTVTVGNGTLSTIGGVTAELKDGKGIYAGHTTSEGILEETLEDDGYKPDTSNAFYALDLTDFPDDDKDEKTAGMQLLVPTSGYGDISIQFDMRHGNKCANTVVLQYTTDGATWLDADTFVVSISDDTWFLRSFDFSAISEVDDNDNFGIRVVSAFATGTTAYQASNPEKDYKDSKGYRFDNILISGSAIEDQGIETAEETIVESQWKLINRTLYFGEMTDNVICVYDITGKTVVTYSPAESVVLNQSKGIYIVRVGNDVQKIFLR